MFRLALSMMVLAVARDAWSIVVGTAPRPPSHFDMSGNGSSLQLGGASTVDSTANGLELVARDHLEVRRVEVRGSRGGGPDISLRSGDFGHDVASGGCAFLPENAEPFAMRIPFPLGPRLLIRSSSDLCCNGTRDLCQSLSQCIRLNRRRFDGRRFMWLAHKVSSRRSNESSVGCKLWLRKKNSTRVGRRTLAPSSAFCHDSGGIDCASNVGRIPNHSDQAWRAVHRELNDGEGETCCFSLALRPGALPSYQPRQKCAD
ncbi:hypothetical protein PF004_g26828 [Phytophthora fragariae]|uniref:RxLR effector protein n=1 Tax=Phytophthora fragariae TaxID=53985 RepID=A0A6G0MN98_9STRA|nr:hypothetical protein PF004_g26828 [Phytophthora fragariae]